MNSAMLYWFPASFGERDGRTFVYAIVDGKAQRRPVVTGESQDEMVEMTSGVVEGERIVVAAPRTMAEGLRCAR
jgi:multidrug efflux pump subunit AcrA (membrane-fusion protein)